MVPSRASRSTNNMAKPWVIRSLDDGIKHLRDYAIKHGDGRVPKGFIAPSGFPLGAWIRGIRGVNYADPDRVPATVRNQLDLVGFVWYTRSAVQSWDDRLVSMRRYAADFGNLLIPVDYIDPDGVTLGRYINSLRSNFSQGKLNLERVATLDAMGFIWNAPDHMWEESFAALERYVASFGRLPFVKTEVFEGRRLVTWVVMQVRKYREGNLTSSQVSRMAALGVKFDTPPKYVSINMAGVIKQITMHSAIHPTHNEKCETPDGWRYARLIKRAVNVQAHGKLSAEHAAALSAANTEILSRTAIMERRVRAELNAYVAAHGAEPVPYDYVAPSGHKLGEVLQSYRGRVTDQEMKRLLTETGQFRYIWDEDLDLIVDEVACIGGLEDITMLTFGTATWIKYHQKRADVLHPPW